MSVGPRVRPSDSSMRPNTPSSWGTRAIAWYKGSPGWQRAIVGGILVSVLLLGTVLLGLSLIGRAAITNGLISLIVVVALGVFTGNSGILSLGHVGFVAVGAYVGGLLTMPAPIKAAALPDLPQWLSEMVLPFPVAMAVAVGVVAVIALVFGIAVARPSGFAAAIATLGVLVVVRSGLVGLDTFTRGAQTFYGVPRETTLFLALGVAVAVILMARLFRESKTGLRLRATRDDELAARSFGANVAGLRFRAWMLSAIIAGAGGVLMAHFITAFSPNQFFLSLTLTYLVMLIVGGAGTVFGAVFGAMAITIGTEMIRGAESGFTLGPVEFPAFFGLPEFLLALGMLLVLFFRPQGVFGVREPDEAIVQFLMRPARRSASEGEPPPAPGDRR